ncbi:hypothetical protein BDN72DRAFT_805695 [Pluteus cervinus]|uniref:Uncharacterized protein n=1 Tax=Pluteus cervinus TaxID=181527 RepID=A0ACD3A3J6_9AGAR|nr:hypothetical protein BDN72DRAFT_805695 [Pluteus cervinus]
MSEVVRGPETYGLTQRREKDSTSNVSDSRRFFSYSPKTTSISYPWPPHITGLERIALSAQGDLQRVLSAFFARPITIALVYSDTFTVSSDNLTMIPLKLPNPQAVAAASPEVPLVQTRQVHLLCAGRIVCTATSTVRISSPQCANLFLEEKFAIGQMFVELRRVPCFELIDVGTRPRPGGLAWSLDDHEIWRKYKLSIPDFECEILEVFPSRRMFLDGEGWLLNEGGLPGSLISEVVWTRIRWGLLFLVLATFAAVLVLTKFSIAQMICIAQ